MSDFVHLNVHSEYSAMEGLASLDSLCEAARERGFGALALTDSNALYGAVRFQEIAKKNGLKPIVGVELSHNRNRALLLAKNRDGYANLCRIVSARHEDMGFDLTAAVAQRRRGLIVLSDSAASLASWKRHSMDDLYVEVRAGTNMQAAADLSRREKIPPVATYRVCFIDPDEYRLYPVLQAIRLNTKLDRLPKPDQVLSHQWLVPAVFAEREFANLPEAIANTRRIADDCELGADIQTTVSPVFAGLDGAAAFLRLKENTYAGALRRYGEITSAASERIERELEIVREKNYAHYFLIVKDIVTNAPISCGRGSGAGSMISYCLGITHVDPLEHNLTFERFLNTHRNDPPDIDIDLPWDEREALLRAVFARYGRQRVAMVANHNRFGWAGAVREVAKVYGIAPAEITRVCGRLLKQQEIMRLSENRQALAWRESVARVRLPEPWPEIVALALQIDGRFRNLSLHCGGIVIVADEIRSYAPVERAPSGPAVLQWDKEDVEQAGLIKIDLLGNRSLSVIRDALTSVLESHRRPMEYETWKPTADARTREIIQKGDTIGCFNIESPAVRLLLKKLWREMPPERRAAADVFQYLVMVSSLVRPAAISYVGEFIRRAHAGDSRALDPAIQDILQDSHGLMLYQENVPAVAVALAGFSARQADELRRALNKKRKAKQLQQFREDFFHGACARGVPLPVVDSVWSMILSFAGYSFCKAHAASYAEVSFRCAYLKAHHPAEFMAAVLSNEGGYYPTFAYISEARRLGLAIQEPDINQSEWRYRGRDRAIRMGFMHIRGIKKTLIENVLAERSARGPFRSFDDFWSRSDVGLAQARLLIKAGCFDSIADGLTRAGTLWRAYALDAGQAPGQLPNPEQYSEQKRLAHEADSFGFLISRHPLDLYCSATALRSLVRAGDLTRHVGRRVRVLGWPITEKLTQTKRADAMAFVTFEDSSAIYEATFFPDSYRRLWHRLTPNRPFVVTGIVEKEFGAITLNVKELARLDVARPRCYAPKHGGEGGQAEAIGGRLPAAAAHAGSDARSGALLQRMRSL
jgi:error-prone DNA polymerase